MRVRRRTASDEVAVGARIILGPDGEAVAPVAAAVAAEAAISAVAADMVWGYMSRAKAHSVFSW